MNPLATFRDSILKFILSIRGGERERGREERVQATQDPLLKTSLRLCNPLGQLNDECTGLSPFYLHHETHLSEL